MFRPKVYEILEIEYDRNKKKHFQSNEDLKYYIIPYKNKKCIIYFPLKGIVSLVNKTFIDEINSDNLVVKEFFKSILEQPTIKMVNHPGFLSDISLELTKACNLKCIYCFAHGGDKPKYMNWETAKAGIDWVIKRSKEKQFSLHFYGSGEPLLAFPMIKKCYEYVENQCKKYNLELLSSMTTNGTLINEDIAQWFKNTGISILISFDGTPEIQNTQRPFRDGSGSYDAVKRSIELLNKNMVPYYVSSIITKDFKTNAYDIIKHLHKLGVKQCGMGYVRSWGRYSNKPEKNKSDYEIYLNEFEDIKRFAKKNNIVLEQTERGRIHHFPQFQCASCGAKVLITSEGYISSCQTVMNKTDPASKEFFYGKIKDGKVIIDKKKLAYLRNRTVNNMSQCKNCFVKYMCSGGCLAAAARSTGSIYMQSNTECSIEKLKCEEQLKSLFN